MIASIAMIVGHSLRRHLLSTTVTIASAALASGLVMAVFSISKQSTRAFAGGKMRYDAVLGARGSELQLVLNTVYHLETSPGNIPWSLYESIKAEPGVKLAIPYALGDNYRGHRVVGTTVELFDPYVVEREGRMQLRAPGLGRPFEPERREAVVGSSVAREAGLGYGAEFSPAHGVIGEGREHEEVYIVVGVLEPTNSPNDRVIWIPIEGVFRMGGHYLRGAGEAFEADPEQAIPDEHKEVSAVMLVFGEGRTGARLQREINFEGKQATLAWPIAKSMLDFIYKLGWVNRVLELVAYLLVAVAAGSLLASLYNTMNERRREFAIMRALGARRATVFGVILAEAATIAGTGALLGYLVYLAILAVAKGIVRSRTGVVLDMTLVHPILYWTPLGMVFVGLVAGLLPALRAYSTDVASTLAGSG